MRFHSLPPALAIVLLAGTFLIQSQMLAQDEQPEPQQTKSHQHKNALIKETSPYLLMHAHNPVHWYGWGDEALSLAKSTNKPIFLSIGYSSCHWCHVMERESFLDEEIANFLNDNFVCIKVDREERPDVDAIYMESLRIVNRRTNGGWPLSMFLTPDARPFFGGTYFPARDGDRGVRIGFLTVVKRVHDAWINNTKKIKEDADFVVDAVKKRLAGQTISPDQEIDPNWIKSCQAQLTQMFDPEFGGFGFSPANPNRPKFPEPSNLLFLIDVVNASPENAPAKTQLIKTAERMMMGGILDHLGGGFHRYSVDRYWKIPHFEKMLYDNAQLATVYSELYRMTQRPEFKMVVDELLDFVSREMLDDEGGFYSALDAESEGEEGKFYRWTKQEISTTLSPEEFKLFSQIYGINNAPNFENKYFVPQLNSTVAVNAADVSMNPVELLKKLQPIRQKLFNLRSKRARPLTDTKVLASWNGMMIRGFADAGRIFENENYVATARKAADFILQKMIASDGRLFRTYTDGQAKLNAYLPDYADVIDGLLALHQTTNEQRWLDEALKLQKKQDALFWDPVSGGYFYTSNDHQELLARAKRSNDGPVPSGNSVATGNLIYFADQLKDNSYILKAKKTALTSSVLIEQYPSAAPRLLMHVRTLSNSQ